MVANGTKKRLTKAQKIILIFKVLRDEPSLELGNRDLLELASRLVEALQQDKTKIEPVVPPGWNYYSRDTYSHMTTDAFAIQSVFEEAKRYGFNCEEADYDQKHFTVLEKHRGADNRAILERIYSRVKRN